MPTRWFGGPPPAEGTRAVDSADERLHDPFVVEYATIAAALSMLASSLGGAFASVLPATDAKAGARIAAVAQSHGVSASRARAAYAKAPYGTPAQRYLYAIGWVGSASDLQKCTAARLLGPDPATAAAQALRASPKTLALLRRAHLTVARAAAALARGAADGCA